MAAAPDPVVVHNKAQFMAALFEALATAKQMPASLRNHLAYGRSVGKNFLKPHFRMQRIAAVKLPLEKSFEAAAYNSGAETIKGVPEAKASAALTGAMGKVEEAVKGGKQPLMGESVDVLIELSKIMPLPQPVLKPTLDSLVTAGVLDNAEVDEIAAKVPANPFTPDQVYEAVAERLDAAKDGRTATYRKLGKAPPVQQNVTKAGFFQIVEMSKDKQFATMPINTQMAAHMACGPKRANFTHLDAVGHPAARGLIEDLTNILLIGTNVAELDKEKSVNITLRSIAQDPINMSFRTMIDKSVAQSAPSAKQPASAPAPSQKAPVTAAPNAPGETNFLEVFEKLKQMGQGVTVQIEMLEAVFGQLVAGNVATQDEVEKAKAELKTKADDKGQVTFPVIQEVFMGIFGSKLGQPAK